MDIFTQAAVFFTTGCIFSATGAVVAFGIDRWMKVPKRYRMIMDAYAEGLKDAKRAQEDAV